MNKKFLLLSLLTVSPLCAEGLGLTVNEATSMQLGYQIVKNTISYGIYPIAESGAKASFNALTETYKQNPSAFTGWTVAAGLLTYQFGPSIWKWLKNNYRTKVTQTTTQSASRSVQEERWTGMLSLLNYIPFLK